MNVTESQLATALEGFTLIGRPLKGPYVPVTVEVDDADTFAQALYATLSRMAALREPHPRCTDAGCSYCSPEPVVDAHICREHAGTDPELSAIAALIPALPLVARLGHDARERVMDWAKRRATDGLAPF